MYARETDITERVSSGNSCIVFMASVPSSSTELKKRVYCHRRHQWAIQLKNKHRQK